MLSYAKIGLSDAYCNYNLTKDPRVRHGQKSRTPTSEIKQKSEREIRNQVANLRARPYTFADLRVRPYTFADCNRNQKLLKLKSGNHLEIQKSRTPDWRVSDPSQGPAANACACDGIINYGKLRCSVTRQARALDTHDYLKCVTKTRYKSTIYIYK